MSKGPVPVIVVFGPTAVGKTEFLLNFRNISEVISFDSLQVYRYMDIGTAKPDSRTLSLIRHHLVDCLEPDREFNTGDFVSLADNLCSEIYSRGLVPLVSGGNAFFLRNFIYGLPVTPASDPAVREKTALRLKTEGIDALREELREIDPEYLSKIGEKDAYRITRALEIYYSSGKTVSSCAVPSEPRKQYDFFLVGLSRERKELYRRIEDRVDRMFEGGLYREFLKLRDMGYGPMSPGMTGIGYREFFELDNNPSLAIDDIREIIKKDTRHYAKRQITFFRKIDNVIWENPENTAVVLQKAASFLACYGKTL